MQSTQSPPQLSLPSTKECPLIQLTSSKKQSNIPSSPTCIYVLNYRIKSETPGRLSLKYLPSVM